MWCSQFRLLIRDKENFAELDPRRFCMILLRIDNCHLNIQNMYNVLELSVLQVHPMMNSLPKCWQNSVSKMVTPNIFIMEEQWLTSKIIALWQIWSWQLPNIGGWEKMASKKRFCFFLTDLLSNLQSVWTSVIHGWKGNTIRRFLVEGKQFSFHYIASTFSWCHDGHLLG